MPILGDTVKLHVEFHDFTNTLADPDTIILNIYDTLKKLIAGPITVTTMYKISTGVYEYPYVIPSNYNYSGLFYEFIADLEDFPVVTRGVINIQWA